MSIDLPSTPNRTRRRRNRAAPRRSESRSLPWSAYGGRLRRRLEVSGFSPNDRLYEAAATAYEGLFTLNVLPHHDACERNSTVEPAADRQI